MGLDEGPCVRTDDSPVLAEGLADEPHKGLANGAGLDEVSADGKLQQAPRSDVYRKILAGSGFVLSMPFQ